jgi:hypothetical protein
VTSKERVDPPTMVPAGTVIDGSVVQAAFAAGPNAPSPSTAATALGPLTRSGGRASPCTAVASSSSKAVVAGPRNRLEKRRNDDVVAEPWVQCDSCKCWVHQVI